MNPAADPPSPCALGVFARAPRPGEAKTRLAATLGDERAAALYEAFLTDSLDACRAAGEMDTVVFCTAGSEAYFAARHPDLPLLAQQGESLGERLENAVVALAARGAAAVGVIGTDHPTLPAELLRLAWGAVRAGRDGAIGPADDGGYYLLVLAGAVARERRGAGLFDGIPWSTAAVLATTLARAAAAGLDLERLPPWYDVDTGADLERLAAELAVDAAARQRAPATARVLAELQAGAHSGPHNAARDPHVAAS